MGRRRWAAHTPTPAPPASALGTGVFRVPGTGTAAGPPALQARGTGTRLRATNGLRLASRQTNGRWESSSRRHTSGSSSLTHTNSASFSGAIPQQSFPSGFRSLLERAAHALAA